MLSVVMLSVMAPKIVRTTFFFENSVAYKLLNKNK
jgi:hypothetical protein